MTASTVKMPPPGGADRLEFNMTQVHNIIKSGYTSIVSRLDNPPMDDLGNFLGYCEAWVNTVDVHHHIEDAKIFAFLSSNLDFSKESAQHALIHIELDALLNTFRAAKADRSKFDPQALKIAMTAFQPTLFTHLDEELKLVSAAKVGAVFDDTSLQKLHAEVNEYANGQGDPYMIIPFMTSHTHPELAPKWPQLPWVPGKDMFAKKYPGYWMYGPYSPYPST